MVSDLVTLNDMLAEHASARGHSIFIAHRNSCYSYKQSWHLAECFAAFLGEHGVVKGDRVGIALPRRPESILAFLGATRIGALPFGVNYLLPTEQILGFIGSVQPRVIVSAGAFLEVALQARDSLDQTIVVVDADGRHSACDSWCEITSLQAPAITQRPSPEDVAYLNFTTGTSGAAKGALATHANLYWNTRSAMDCFNLTEQDVHLVMFASFAHPHELFCRALMTGGKLVLLEEINPKTIAQTISRHRVTCMMGLAPMYAMMGDYCEPTGFDSLRIAESGGMYTSPAINQKFADTAGVPILSVWGSTETTGVALANTPDAHRVDGAMGKACPYYEVKLADDAGEPVAPGQVGELWIRGAAVVSGYQGVGSILDAHGWYRSGDLARRTEDGFFYFVERVSGLIKVAGLKVYPLQVEIALLGLPGVKDAAVVEARDARRGAVPVAFVVCNGGGLTEGEILAWCRPRLSSYMVPRKIFLLDSLPKIGSGKTNKRQLATTYAADLQLPSGSDRKTT